MFAWKESKACSKWKRDFYKDFMFDIAEASLKIQSLDILVIEGIPEITLEYLGS